MLAGIGATAVASLMLLARLSGKQGGGDGVMKEEVCSLLMLVLVCVCVCVCICPSPPASSSSSRSLPQSQYCDICNDVGEAEMDMSRFMRARVCVLSSSSSSSTPSSAS